MVSTKDPSYDLGLKPRVTIKSRDGLDTHYTFNAHDPGGSPLILSHTSVDNAIGETGSYNLLIADHNNDLDKDLLRNSKVFIEIGKSEEELRHFLIGYTDIFDIERVGTNSQVYRMSGFGTVAQANRILLLMRKSAELDDDDNLIPDPEYSVGRLYQRSLDERNFRPHNDRAIRDILGWTHSQVDQNELKTQYLLINEVFTTLWDYWDRLASLEGANWYLDYDNGLEDLAVKHPSKLHSGITVRNGPKQDSHDARFTSYIDGSFTWTEDSSPNAGVRTGLYTTTIIDRDKVASSQVSNGETKLNQRFIGQQVTLPNDQRRITSLAFRLEKIGEPESPNSRVNGRIILDDNDKPNGDIIGRFSISLGDIDESTGWVVTDNVDIDSGSFQGITKFWLVLLDRSGIDGDVEDDGDNTISWHHDADFTTHTSGNLSATVNVSNEEQRDDSNDLIWAVSTNGPKYTYKIYSDIKRMQSAFDQGAEQLIGLSEQFIDSSFLHLPASVNKFLSLNLSIMSKPRITIPSITVSIPNDFIFKPYEYVSFIDELSGLEQDLQITSVQYTFSALPGDPQYAAYDAQLSLSSSFNPIIGSCNCL